MTKKALENIDEGILTVVVDNFASKENVIKFAQSAGATAEFTETDGIFTIDIAVGYPCELPSKLQNGENNNADNIVVFISTDYIGDDNDLGKTLMNGFIGNLINMDTLPKTIIMVNSAINLSTLNNDTVKALQVLAEKGIETLSCGACLTFFNVEHDLKVGEITDAHRVMTRLFEADKVIKL